MDNEKLYHSDIYLGEVYDDGIKHWKYIKKEKKNGRWVYYYHHDEYENSKKDYGKKFEAYKKAEDQKMEATSKRVSAANDFALTNFSREFGNAVYNSRYKGKILVDPIAKYQYKKKLNKLDKDYIKTSKALNKARDNEEASSEKLENARANFNKASSKYNKITNRTKIERFIGRLTTKTLNKISKTNYDTKRKGKKFIDDIFG